MDLKKQAAQKAIEYVHDGMIVGLGTGSTTTHFIELLGQKINQRELKGIRAVPTSDSTARLARDLGIPLTTLTDHPKVDLAVDGADEVDPNLDLIKGLGQALLREKIVEIHSVEFIVIVDESKIVPRLGTVKPLPVEIVQFEALAHIHWLSSLGCRAELWLGDDGKPLNTDNGNYLARCWFNELSHNGIEDPYSLADTLAKRPGIVEHGLFLGMATRIIVAGRDGLKILSRKKKIKDYMLQSNQPVL